MGILARVVGLAAIGSAMVATRAEAQRCPDTPPTYRPHVHAFERATLVTDGRVSVHVYFSRQFCTTSQASVPPVRPADVAITATDERGGVTRLVVRTRGEELLTTLPSAGTFTMRIAAPRERSLEPAVFRVRAVAAAAAVPATLRLHAPARDAGRPLDGRLFCRDPDGFALAPVAVSGTRGTASARVSWPPGDFACEWRAGDQRVRHTRIAVTAAGPVDVAFPGSRIEVEGDWQPGEGAMYRITEVRGGRVEERMPFDPAFGTADDDVDPGALTLVLESTPRVDPWSPELPGLVWTERHREDVLVPSDTTLRLAWSMPRALVDHQSGRVPASALPGWPGSSPAPAGPGDLPTVGSSFGAFSVHDGVAVLVGAHAWEHRAGRWWRLAMPSSFTIGDRETGAQRARIAFVDGSNVWAMVDDGVAITTRTARGLAQEMPMLYTTDHAYPCRIHAIVATAITDIVAVGSCRPNAPAWDAVRTDGFVVARDATRWSPPQWLGGPLFDVARSGDRLFAVGARGTIATRERGVWRSVVVSPFAYARVAAGEHSVVAIDQQGSVRVWSSDRVDAASSHDLPQLTVRSIPRAIGQLCVTRDDRIVVWSDAWRRPNEGGHGPFEGPAAIAVWSGSAWTELPGPAGGEPLALACDGANAYALVRSDRGIVPVRWPLP